MTCLELNIKYWTSPDLNSMRWLRLFANKTFRKHRKLIFLHRDFIICIVSLGIFHPHFSIRILPSPFFHPHFIIRNFPSAFFYPPSAIRRHPDRTLQRPPMRRQFTLHTICINFQVVFFADNFRECADLNAFHEEIFKLHFLLNQGRSIF